MRALQIVKPREFKIVQIDRPEPAADEVVVKLRYAAICNQNDYKIFYGLYDDLIKYPCEPGVFGHEGVGIVDAVGAGVEDLRVGDQVALTGDGGPMLYMEYVKRKAKTVVKVDATVDPRHVAVLELFGCARHCLEIAGDLSGKRVAITGLGPAGLCLLQLARRKRPAAIWGLDPAADRRLAAEQLGCDRTFDPTDAAVYQQLLKDGPDVVIEATGIPQVILNAFDITRREVVIFGFTNQPFTVDQSKWFQKELVIKNSKVQTIDDLRAVVAMLEAGELAVEALISGIMSFDDYAQAVEKVYRKEAIKILLEWR